ncbi:FadR/GntR family transcriptional regulator [Kribbella italica]|uniref:DNA-binding FadR family transcriptional regulator n=1 Tax=Kribbella italica TaxID=1540520 RepID=A0A7W9J7L8_9ACTN|nr:FCD domain-containing protein [Kribbella italica]MBB5836577.1 DNA-binding FadR family transcriptional regulator [Kribbella italica]
MSLVRQVPLVVQVSEQFRGLIESGEWPRGERIPGENQLATELGVSRGTVREALRSLSLTGLLEPRVGDGTYVLATDEISGVLLRDELSELDYVFDARAGIEAAAARLAAGRPSAGRIKGLIAALEARDAAHDASDLDAFVVADTAFHRGVVEASGNPLLLRLYDAIGDLLVESIEQSASFPEHPQLRAAHLDVFEAIAAADPDAAARASYALIETVKQSQ